MFPRFPLLLLGKNFKSAGHTTSKKACPRVKKIIIIYTETKWLPQALQTRFQVTLLKQKHGRAFEHGGEGGERGS